MASSFPSFHDPFISVGSCRVGDVFLADDSRSDEGKVVVAVNVVVLVAGNVAVVTSCCHDESECGCLTMDQYFCDSEMCSMSGAGGENVLDVDDG